VKTKKSVAAHVQQMAISKGRRLPVATGKMRRALLQVLAASASNQHAQASPNVMVK